MSMSYYTFFRPTHIPILLLMLPRWIRIEVTLTIWISRRSNIRLLRIVVLNNVIGISIGTIIVLMDHHRPEDLLVLGLVLLMTPIIHGTQTHLKKDRFPLIPGHALVPKAAIVAGVAAEVQAKIIQAYKNITSLATAISIAESGSIKIGQPHVMIVNDENTRKRRERRTRRRRKGMKKDGVSWLVKRFVQNWFSG